MSAHLIHKMKSTEKLKSNGRKRVLKIIQTERNKKISPTKMKNRQNIKTKKKMGRKKKIRAQKFIFKAYGTMDHTKKIHDTYMMLP